MEIKSFIKATWEVPQNALGSIVKKVCKAKVCTTYKEATVYTWGINGGMSLGKHIFVPFTVEDLKHPYVQSVIKHEYGHTIQSKYLGWLYLLVIGLPSFIWAQCFDKYRAKTGTSYYAFYTERWADKLGGVERSKK